MVVKHYETEWLFRRDVNPFATTDWWPWGGYDTLEEAKRKVRKEMTDGSSAYSRGRVVIFLYRVEAGGRIVGSERNVVFELARKEVAR